MNISILALFIFALVLNCAEAQSPANQSQIALPAPTPYAIVDQDANSRVWQRQEYEAGPNGQIVTNIISYKELASGLNYLSNGQWTASQEQVNILPDGSASSTNGQHQVYFPADIYEGQIEMVTPAPDGKHIFSRLVELSYFDGTNTAVLAELTNSVGEVVGNNQVVYPNAFSGLKADIRYSYTRSGLE